MGSTSSTAKEKRRVLRKRLKGTVTFTARTYASTCLAPRPTIVPQTVPVHAWQPLCLYRWRGHKPCRKSLAWLCLCSSSPILCPEIVRPRFHLLHTPPLAEPFTSKPSCPESQRRTVQHATKLRANSQLQNPRQCLNACT